MSIMLDKLMDCDGMVVDCIADCDFEDYDLVVIGIIGSLEVMCKLILEVLVGIFEGWELF